MHYTTPPVRVPVVQTPNGDTSQVVGVGKETVVGLGSFHKSLPHNAFGEVDPAAFHDLVTRLADPHDDLEGVASGARDADKLVNPLAARAREGLGPEPGWCTMPPAPRFASASTAAEMTELYWMALMRDVSLDQIWSGAHPDVAAAIADLQAPFVAAVGSGDPGRLRLGLDVPDMPPWTAKNLFRIGLPGELDGPMVSQLFMHDVRYGTQLIVQKQRTYKAGRDYLTDHASWLRAQDAGLDGDGHGYGDDNGASPCDDPTYFEPGAGGLAWRRIATMRDLARFVNKDALHQAYFNAALLLDAWGAPVDPRNPYVSGLSRSRGFGTLGGPHLLALVSEVASRALKAVWHQKWSVHLRARPEAYAGALHMQEIGIAAGKRAYGLPTTAASSVAGQRVRAKYGTLFLPMAFSAGSPVHPAYGAGHATVAGACVTILKAWFDEDAKLVDVIAGKKHPLTCDAVYLVDPGLRLTAAPDGTGGSAPSPLAADDAAKLTVGGELNKLAANVAMGRSMGGVHWRSDNTRSLRLGQKIATFILHKMIAEVAEPGAALSFRSFGGEAIQIRKIGAHTSEIRVGGAPAEWYEVE